MIRRVLVAVGVLAFLFGIVSILVPGLVAIPIDRAVLSVVGVLALALAVRVVQTWKNRTFERARTPDPELPAPNRVPGDDLDEVLATFTKTRAGGVYHIRTRPALVAAAEAIIVRSQHVTPERAQELIADGTWTDDPLAASYLGGGTGNGIPLRVRLRHAMTRSSLERRLISHTVDAIAREADSIAVTAGDDVGGGGARGGDNSGRSDDTGRNGDAKRGDGERAERATDRDAPRVIRSALPREEDDGALRQTGHFYGVSALALVGIGVGVVAESPPILLSGVVGIGFAAYSRAGAEPVGDVSIERTLSTDRPDDGEVVDVTVTVRNEGDRYLPDVRITDGVPAALTVETGSARHGTALRPGEEATFTYELIARRGVHSFGPAQVLSRPIAATLERERTIRAETTLTCVPELEPVRVPVPLRAQTTSYPGRIDTDVKGEGLEFYSTREYQMGDPLRRIDWNRRARSGELATLEFREERMATVILVIDARSVAYRAPGPHRRTAVERSIDGAGSVFARLLDDGDRVGITAFGPEGCWLAPALGDDHRLRARELLATHPSLSSTPPEGTFSPVLWKRRFRERLSPGSQIIYFTPLADEYAARVARQLDAYGHPVTVVSPDPTTDRTSSHQLAKVARTINLADLRSHGIRAVDWGPDEPIELAFIRAERRWSR